MTLLSANLGRALLEGGVDVDVDLTVVGQVVLIVVLLLVLKPVLFDPMLRLFEEREKRIDGAKKSARQIDKKSAEAEAEFEAAMFKAQAEGNAVRERLRNEGVKAENEVLAKVRAETAELLASGRKKAADELAEARRGLQADGQALGRELAARVLGREVT